jgi:LPS-assembly protein
MDTRYWDQLDRSLEASTMEKLPSFGYTILPTGIGDLPLYYGLDSSLVNYYRAEGDRGSRLLASPRLYLPFQWKSYLDVEASTGIAASSYWVDWESGNGDPVEGRAVTDVRLGVSSRVNRVYPVQFGNTVALQHSLRPEVLYEYVPDPLEGQVPLFDRLDSNPRMNRVEYGLSTFLTSKSVTKDTAGEETSAYLEMARLKIFQGYNIEKTSSDVKAILLDTARERGFTDLGLRLDLTPKKFVTFSYDLDVSLDQGMASVHDVYLTYKSGRGDIFRVDYQYRADSVIDELITRLNVAVLPNLRFITYLDYSFDQQELFAQGYGFRYDHGCWALGVAYENKDNDHRVALTVNLLGLGTFGSSRTYAEGSD